MTLLAKYGDNHAQVDHARIDASTNSLQVVDYTHHEIHAGSAFYVMFSVADLGAAATPTDIMSLSWKTPNTTKWGHFAFSGTGTAGWRLRLIEAPSGGVATPDGQLTILNHNRNSTTTSTFTESTGATAGEVDYDASLATGGTTLWDQYLEGAGGPQGGSVGGGSRNEIVLKQNTVYQLSLYGTDADPGTLYMDWYEHTDKH